LGNDSYQRVGSSNDSNHEADDNSSGEESPASKGPKGSDEDSAGNDTASSVSSQGLSQRGDSSSDENNDDWRTDSTDRHDELIRRRKAKRADKLRYMSTSFQSGRKKSFWPLLEDLMESGTLKPQSWAAWVCDKLCVWTTLVIYIVGFAGLLAYAIGVDQRSRLDFIDTTFPVILHIIGVGTSVLLKVYYDLSPTVGHLESMSLIIRSRMWLFPGILNDMTVQKRSETNKLRMLEVMMEERKENPTEEDSSHFADEDHRFVMLSFLKKCHFPEFRVLLRAFAVFPWSRVEDLKDVKKQDMLMGIARNQIQSAFPVLDLLGVCSSLPSICNPVTYFRLVKHLAVHCLGRQRKVMDPVKFPQYVTRAEDIEEDDVSANIPFYERKEPLPWGTLRLNDCQDRFKEMSAKVNLMAFAIFGLTLASYMTMLLGDLSFFRRLDSLYEEFGGEESGGNLEEYLFQVGRNFSDTKGDAGFSEEEIESWILEYGALHQWSGTAIVLLVVMIPFGIQASALLAENVVYPMLVLRTLTTHIENFSLEVDQYLTMLAINHGSLAHHQTFSQHANEDERVHTKKVAVTRDVALSWRMGRFFNEVTDDSKSINTSVGVMVLNFVCHLIPLNNFVFNPSTKCLPVWLVLFSMSQVLSLVYVIMDGLACNEMIDGGIDTLLHDWQLKFLMIGWSGGFLSAASDDDKQLDGEGAHDCELVNSESGSSDDEENANPDDESEDEDEMKTGDMQFLAYVAKNPGDSYNRTASFAPYDSDADKDTEHSESQQLLQNMEVNRRIDSIIRVLAHYEAESITPLSVLGVTVTQDIVTLIIGFFGGSIIGVFTAVADDKDLIQNVLLCHGFL